MFKKLILSIMALALFCSQNIVFGQGTTTSSMYGKVKDNNGNPLVGATVVAVHTPSGTKYGAITREDGGFNINGMRIGGPYQVTASYSGHSTEQTNDIYLQLGQAFRVNSTLAENTTALREAVVGASRSALNSSQTGAQSIVDNDAINLLPTVSRSIADFTRTNPLATVSGDNTISIAGNNNRFNSIFIDGAVNNDVFGLAASGTNGGQTGGSPISLDAIDQLQIVVAPYDVTIGGFAGGGINAVTRSGTNKTTASVYYLTRNQGLAGKTPTDNPNVTPEKLADFTANIFGARTGGALIKDKLFYFLSIEAQRETTPQPFQFADYRGNSSQADVQAFQDKLRGYGYDAGGYLDNPDELNSNKLFVRLDYNMNEKNKLMFRHSYAYNESLDANRSSANSINFYNNGIFFPSTTNSTALELTTQISSDKTNNLILGFTRVNDDRDPIGDNFPYITIRDGSGTISAGSEQFSTANQLTQNIVTLTDNFKIYKGKNEITIGTHNEFYNIYNLFMRQNYGSYTYNDLASFMTDAAANDYDRGYSLVDNVTGDGSDAAAKFNAIQFGIYAQDEYSVSEKLQISGGLRLDIPMFLTQPRDNPEFNSTTISTLEAAGKDLQGATAGQAPGAQLMFSPRVGFNYDVKNDNNTIIRGGTGIFTSRVPFVWPGGMYTNNGYTVGGVFNQMLVFNPDWQNQPKASDFGGADAIPSGQMDLFVQDFKYPQVWKSSIGADKSLKGGFKLTAEALFNKTINNMVVYNLNIPNTTSTLDGGPDNRPIYNRRSPIDNTYSGVYLVDNTNEGYSYNLMLQLQRVVSEGLSGSFAYTFGQSKSLNDGTSSQNSSNWRFVENVMGRDNLSLSYSDFDMGHRINGFLGYSKKYADKFRTSFSIFYNAQSGQRMSYVISGGNRMTNEDSGDNDLIYIPARQADINLVDYTDANGNVVTAASQWAELDGFISNDKYLDAARGGYAERNGSRLPFQTVLDLRIAQDFYIMSGGQKHDLQITFDVFNFTNLLNKEWGRRYFLSNDQYALYQFEKFSSGTKPEYTFRGKADDTPWTIDDSGINSSRWQAQIGVRYSFN
jgi:hypothetical protein